MFTDFVAHTINIYPSTENISACIDQLYLLTLFLTSGRSNPINPIRVHIYFFYLSSCCIK